LNEDKKLRAVERGLETFIFTSRWLLAPFYAGLALTLAVLLVKFVQELWHIAVTTWTSTEAEVILGVLALVDLTLTGSLLVIVIFSGYENFVSKIDHSGHRDWPEWMGKIDFTGLKLKLLSSIVAISGVHLLKQFMSLKTVSDRDLYWYVIIHLVFVGSSVLLALSDRIAGHGGSAAHAPAAAPANGNPGAEKQVSSKGNGSHESHG
jgi:uncharacterized protein (TIGR00645 family)